MIKQLLLILGFVGFAFVVAAQQDTVLKNTVFEAKKLYEARKFGPSMQKYLKALQLAEATGNHAISAHAALNAGNCRYYINQGNRPAIIQWWYQALSIANKHDIDSVIAKASNNIALLYTESNNIDSSEKYADIALKLFLKRKEYGNASASYAVSALRHIKEPIFNFTKGWELLNKAEHYATLVNDKSRLGYTAINRCIWYGRQKKYRKAVHYADIAEKHYKAVADWDGTRYAYYQKITYLAKLGDTATARYAFLWYNMTDSLLKTENATKIADYETFYKTEKKNRENQLLQKENQLKQLQIEARNRNLFMLIAVFLLFVVAALWWINRNNLKKKQRELEIIKDMQHEKERIARDLHDNVGGQLSYIIYSLDGINSEDEETRTEVTESINQSVRSVIGSLRETIWAISDANIKVSDFADKLKVFARNLFKHTQAKVVFNEHIQQERELNALLGLNIYRICQEILNNAFKYAEASQIIIEFKNDEEGFSISISDNGVGFDILESSETSKYGIINIKNRASEFGITMHLQTESNKGTNYLLIV